MNIQDITKEELIAQLSQLGTRIKELEQQEASRADDVKALQEKSNMLQSLLHHSPEPMAVYDEEGRVLFLNSAFTTTFGWASDELRGQHIDYVPEDCLAETRDTIERRFKGDHVPPFDTRRLTKDGRILDVHISSALFTNSLGQPVGHIVTLRDITERKRTEQALKTSEKNFRTFLETVDDMIVVGTPEGRILYTNTAASGKLGYTPDELRMMNILDLHPREYREEAEKIFADMFSGGREVCPLPLATKNGALWPVETRVWFGKWNDLDCIFGICKDLGREQEALQKFDRLFQNNPALMAVSSIPERRFSDVNRAFLETLGFTREEVIGRTSTELGLFVETESQTGIAQALEKYGRVSDIELKVSRKDGKILHGLFSGEVIESQGQRNLLSVMIDITERKRAEEKLQESEARYRFLAEHANDILWTTDLKLRTTYVSPSVRRVLGFTPEERIQQRVEDQLTADSLAIAQEKLREELQRERGRGSGLDQPVIIELDYRHKNGSIVCLESLVSLIEDEDGTPIGIHGLSRDITERKRAEEALRQREAYLRSILDNAPFLMWLKDREGRFLAVNDVFAESCGQESPEAVIGKTDLDVWPLELAVRYRADDREVMNERRRKHMEEPVFDHGETKWFETFKTPMVNDQGDIMGTTGFARDVSYRKRMEEILRESEEKYRSVFDNAAVGINLKSPDGAFSEINQALADILGYDREELNRLSYLDITHPDDVQVSRKMHTALQRGDIDTYRIEKRYIRNDRKVIWVDTSVSALRDSSGRLRNTVGIITDITDRKNAEEALRESEERFRTLMAQSPIAIAVTGPKGELQYLNNKFIQVFGYTLKDIPTLEHWWRLAYPDAQYAERVKSEWLLATRESAEKMSEAQPVEREIRCRDGRIRLIEVRKTTTATSVIHTFEDITDRKQAEEKREQLLEELRTALAEVKKLSGLLPICASCKKIRDDKGYWQQIERYISDHSEALFSHSICPDCVRKLYPHLIRD